MSHDHLLDTGIIFPVRTALLWIGGQFKLNTGFYPGKHGQTPRAYVLVSDTSVRFNKRYTAKLGKQRTLHSPTFSLPSENMALCGLEH